MLSKNSITDISRSPTTRADLVGAGTLPADQRDAHTELDPDWASPPHMSLNRGLSAAVAFHVRHGHLTVRVDDYEKGFDMYVWLGRCVARRRAGTLPPDVEDVLDLLGIAWDEVIDWDRGVAATRAFHARTGHLYVPAPHLEDGFALLRYLLDCRIIRRRGTLPRYVETALDRLGFVWDEDRAWEIGLAAGHAFYAREGHLRPLSTHREGGVDVHRWLLRARIRRDRNDRSLLPQHRAALDRLATLDPDWGIPPFNTQRGLAAARAFYDREGHLDVPRRCLVNGTALYSFLRECCRLRRRRHLPADVIATLDTFGMNWGADLQR